MRALVDTNVLLRHANRDDPSQLVIAETVEPMLARGDELCICAQNVVEYWAVSTRPLSANGHGKEPRQLRAELEAVLAGFLMLPDPPALFETWLGLCSAHDVRGRQAYDARLVALMLASGITRLVTLNPGDFARYPMVEVIVPGRG